MIRHLRAFAWLRWRLLVNGVRGGQRRDAFERFSRIARLLAPAILLGTFLSVGCALGLLGAVGGWATATGRMDAGLALLIVRALWLVVLAVLVIVPLGRAAYAGGGGGATRLLLLPIPRSTLHLLDVLASLADPWLAFALPGIVLFALGLVAGGRGGAGLFAVAAAAAMAALCATLGSLVSFLMSWLMRSRRRGEVFTLVFVVVFSLLAMVPALVTGRVEERSRKPERREPVPAAIAVARLDGALPLWTRAIPSELYGRSIGSAIEGRPVPAALGLAALALEAALCYGLSSAVHRRLLGTVDSGGGRARRGLERGALRRLPGLTPAASAVAVAQARTALRSVRGRLVVLLIGPAMAALGFFTQRMPEEFPAGALLGGHGHVLLGAGIVFSLYALQAFNMNQFASDRSGLTLQFLTPIADRELVAGKAVGCAFVLAGPVLLDLLSVLLVAAGGSPLTWLAVLLGTVPTYLLLCPLAALLSALFPVASDLSKTGGGGNPHGLAMLVGSLAVMLLAIPAALIVAVAHHGLHRPGLALLLMTLWTITAACIAVPLLGPASRALTPRRENLALVAQGR